MRIGLAGAGRMGARHAQSLTDLPGVSSLVIADADAARAHALAERMARRAGAAVRAADSVDDLFTEPLDGLVVAAATDAHAELVMRAAEMRFPVFCEKPLATDLNGTLQVVGTARRVPVQVGFQRRFDAGHVEVRDAVATGALGWLHTVRSCTLDPAPPPREYIPGSGGLFRDCGVHDFDAIRFVTGRQIARVMAVGANRGDAFFAEYGDVDTATAVLTLDDGTLATVAETRYNGAGYDVRLEAFGSKDTVVAGLDERTPLTPAGGDAPGSPYADFLERFGPAYDAELRAFLDVAAGLEDSPCPPEEALEAFLVAEACEVSRRERRAVDVAEIRRACSLPRLRHGGHGAFAASSSLVADKIARSSRSCPLLSPDEAAP